MEDIEKGWKSVNEKSGLECSHGQHGASEAWYTRTYYYYYSPSFVHLIDSSVIQSVIKRTVLMISTTSKRNNL